jgi:hypothetical protein
MKTILSLVPTLACAWFVVSVHAEKPQADCPRVRGVNHRIPADPAKITSPGLPAANPTAA